MKKLNWILILLFPVVLNLFACAKKYGCKHGEAVNFDSSARRDDGSCLYPIKLGFKWDADAAADQIADGHLYLSFYINDVYVGSDSTSNHNEDVNHFYYYDGVTFMDTVPVSSTSYYMSCKDQDGEVVSTFTKNIYGEKIVAIGFY